MFMVLTREDAVSGMRDMVGPTDPEEAKTSAPDSIRATIGKDKMKNALHVATDEARALEELKLVFGDELQLDASGKVIEAEEEEDIVPAARK